MNVAIASFLAGTRNLMFMDCLVRSFIVGVCACIEIRSLVLARDDAIVGACCVLWMLTAFLDRRTCVKRASQGKTQAVPAR